MMVNGCCSGLLSAGAIALGQNSLRTVAIAAAAQEFSCQAPVFSSHKQKRHAQETGGVRPLATSPLLP
jgi:hypothetical protein